MKVLNHVVELSLSARWPWSHFKIHKYPLYHHLVWGKLSLIYGQPHLETMRVCEHCNGEIQVLSAGDESWDYCEGCQTVEGPTIEISMEEYEKHN